MSELKATPGPWVYREITREVGVLDRSDTQSYGMLLAIAHMDEFDFAEHKENAHLIAAAPDLYEALEELIASHEDLTNWAEDPSIGRPDIEWSLRIAEAAFCTLAKARGES